ncbi:MAG TPA: hypothetical protein VHJ99_00050 [Candidatus Dormibacteraeota bacterium]|nr:hypothetical protein [Candidatus Dormibacteraeota bacterium]
MIIALLVLCACGRAGISQGPGSNASPTRAASPSPAASPTSDPTAAWTTYTSAKWGYSFQHPQAWMDLGSLGAGDTEEYLSNEQVGSPISLDANGIFVAISIHQITGQTCAEHGIFNRAMDKQDAIVVDGTSSTLYALSVDMPFMQLNVERAGYCYMFSFVFTSLQIRDSDENVAAQMLSRTFRFGQPTAPAP